jgi:hypothetical protein
MRVANAIWEGGGQGSIADESMEKAYGLRDQVSRREYFQITNKLFAKQDDLEKAE